MIEIDGIMYPDNLEAEVRVVRVRALADFLLELKFNDGVEATFDVKPLLNTGVFQALRDSAVFHSVYLDSGAPTWNDGEIDIAPEHLYHHSSRHRQDDAEIRMDLEGPQKERGRQLSSLLADPSPETDFDWEP
jgi:hypothetical protein